MKTIGVLFGIENSFPSALVEQINARNIEGIRAEFVRTGAVELDKCPTLRGDRRPHLPRHSLLSRLSQTRRPQRNRGHQQSVLVVGRRQVFQLHAGQAFGRGRASHGDSAAQTLSRGTTERSMRNLEYPLDWDAVFAYVGEHGFLKPIDGGGWRDVYHVHNREEFFRAYDQSRDLCMMYQKAVDFTEYFRCYVVGQKKVRIMPYDPRRPHAERYVKNPHKRAGCCGGAWSRTR
jgi:hypothetical protein